MIPPIITPRHVPSSSNAALSKVPLSKLPVSKLPVSKVPVSKVPVSKVPVSKVPARVLEREQWPTERTISRTVIAWEVPQVTRLASGG